MRIVAALFLVTLLPCGLPAQDTGGFSADVRVNGPLPSYLFGKIVVRSTTEPGGRAAPFSRDGVHYLAAVPVGKVEICVSALGYHTVFDTATIRKKSIIRRKFTLQPDQPISEPYPDCDRSLPVIYVDAVDSAGRRIADEDTYPLWEAVLRHYRRAVRMSEGDFVRLTNRLTGASADTAGTSAIVMSLDRDAVPTPTLLAWLNALPARGLVESVCPAIDVKDCPEIGVTTYLKLKPPRRLHADTMYVVVDELGVDPSACRSPDGTFIGFWTRNYVLVPRDGRWEVIGRSRTPSTSGSGYCKPDEPDPAE